MLPLDTTGFSDLSPEDYKDQTRRHWGGDPCGSSTSDKPYLSREYFDEIEEWRYASHPWILANIKQFGIAGKNVLEIGYGMGTDHLALARAGGVMHGIDLTPGNRTIVEQRFALYGEKTDVITGDAEQLPYADASMDFVYSFGVIHHSPDTEGIIREIRRVLKPGGRAWITVYHRNSVFFWWSVFLADWIGRGGFRRETLRQRLSRIEYPNDSPDMVIRLYGRKEFARLFDDFSRVDTSVDHLVNLDIVGLEGRVPDFRLRRLAKHFGWYVIVEATK